MVAPGETFEVVQNLGSVARLAEDLPIDNDDGVRAEHQRERAGVVDVTGALHRIEAGERLLPRHTLDVAGWGLLERPALVDRNVQHLEPIAEPGQQLPPARRPGREIQRFHWFRERLRQPCDAESLWRVA